MYFTHELTMTQRGSLFILGSIGQRSRSNSEFKLWKFPHDNSITFCHTTMILYTCWSWSKEDLFIFATIGQRSRSNLNFASFLHNKSITVLSERRVCCLWSEEQSYWFWSQWSRSNMLARGLSISNTVIALYSSGTNFCIFSNMWKRGSGK